MPWLAFGPCGLPQRRCGGLATKRFKKWGLSAVLLSATLCLPGAPAQAQQYKIGYVNPVRALQGSPQAQSALQALEREFTPRRRELEGVDTEIKGMEQRLSKDAAIMSESERSNLERSIYDKKRDFQRDSEEYQEDLNFRRNEELGKIQRQLLEAIQAIAKAQQFDLIVGEGVIHASEKIDITDQVIEQLKRSTAQPAAQ
jgi:outer membrane protein